ncbi:PAS domain S-box protein [Capsulimonas corticalis]|nr:PAS domain S-box protein [Capsulimonas corticalis]
MIKDQAWETARLEELHAYEILDSEEEAIYSDLAKLASHICGVPIALITFVDEGRQWFKAKVGLEISETPLSMAFCAHAILQDDVLVVSDTTQDLRFADNPFVTGDSHIRFYAGAPLITPSGYALGTICAVDTVVRTLEPEQIEALAALSRQVVNLLETRRKLRLSDEALTMRDASAAALRTGQGRSHAILKSALDCIISIDSFGNILEFNPAAEETFGYTAEEAMGRELAALIVPERFRDAHRQGLSRCLETGTGSLLGSRVEVVAQRKDGAELSVELALVAFDNAGKTEFTAYLRDITERVATLEALQASERQFRAVFDSALDAILVSSNGEFVYANSSLLNLFGFLSEEELAKVPMWTLVAPEDREMVATRGMLRAQGHDVLASYEVRCVRADGSMIDVELYASAYTYQGRNYSVVSLRDITDRKRMEEAISESEERYRLLAEFGSDIITVIAFDGTVLYESPSLTRVLGYEPSEFVGSASARVIHPEDLELVNMAFHDAMWKGGFAEPVTYRIRHKNGSWRYLEMTGNTLTGHPTMEGMIVHSRDVTDRRLAQIELESAHEYLEARVEERTAAVEEANASLQAEIAERMEIERTLRATEEKFRGIFENASEGIFQTTPEGKYISANPALARIYGYSTPADLVAGLTDIADKLYVSPGRRQEFVARISDDGSVSNFESQVLRADGEVVWISENARVVRGDEGEILYYEGTVEDITQRKVLEVERESMLREAIERADHDPLTGLLNHRAFHKRWNEEADRAQRDGSPLGVAILDLDNFSFFNDAYGHAVGDDVLRRVAQTLVACCRGYDILGRYGGDEFIMILPGMDADEMVILEERLNDGLSRTGFRPPGSDNLIPLTVSIGAAVFPDDGGSRTDVLACAAERLGRAKSGGGGGASDTVRAALNRTVEGFPMLNALVSAVDNKDRYTRRHSEDVLVYCLEIAEEMGMDDAAKQRIEIAALLHDVGKIGVPDDILRKPGKLTDEEFEAVKQHPTIGAVIVGAVPGLSDTLDAVRHHHERWDGRGYPAALRGLEIPLIARVMAVADAFSAMTTNRPYRKGMPEEKALAILADGAGTQWDPACVQAFLAAHPPAPMVSDEGEARLAEEPPADN